MGQLGFGKNVEVCDIPRKIEELHNITQIFAGDYVSMAISKDKRIYAWGYNKHNRLSLNKHGK